MTTTPQTNSLTPYTLRLVQRFGTVGAIAAHIRNENRFRAVGHQVRDPLAYAAAVMAAYRAASAADVERCQRAINELMS